jgi:hypothetical protein
MENLQLDFEELYSEVKRRAGDEGAYSQEAWNSVVDTVISEKLDYGEVDEDVDVEGLREALESRYQDFESDAQEM